MQRRRLSQFVSRSPELVGFYQRLVLRVLFHGSRATGITVHRDGQEETLFAGSEIVLAAGAYGSPQILMLSGIGPADELAPNRSPKHWSLRRAPATGWPPQ
jgi:choline dehydrogenase-like flavoprotein